MPTNTQQSYCDWFRCRQRCMYTTVYARYRGLNRSHLPPHPPWHYFDFCFSAYALNELHKFTSIFIRNSETKMFTKFRVKASLKYSWWDPNSQGPFGKTVHFKRKRLKFAWSILEVEFWHFHDHWHSELIKVVIKTSQLLDSLLSKKNFR